MMRSGGGLMGIRSFKARDKGAGASNLLLEDFTNLLLEDGTSVLLLE